MQPTGQYGAMDRKSRFRLEQAIGFHVNRVAFLMSEEIARRFAAAGHPISAQDFGILHRLRQQGAMTPAEIATLMRRDKTTITRRLDGLAKKGLIERRPHPDDRRCVLIALSGDGQQTLEAVTPLVQAFQQEVLQGVPKADREVTLRTLQHIASILDATDSAKKEKT